MKLIFKESSAAELGTTCASMNRTGKSNAKKGPEKDYNAFRDFTDRETVTCDQALFSFRSVNRA